MTRADGASLPESLGFALRPETEADAAFRLGLFRASRGAALSRAGLPPELLDQIIVQQFGAQTLGYRAAYPDARLEIVTVEGLSVGRLATHRGPQALHLIDIDLKPAWRGRGVGGAILQVLMAEAAERGQPLTLQVARDNLGAQQLYHRLGFVLTAATDTDLSLAWTASTEAP